MNRPVSAAEMEVFDRRYPKLEQPVARPIRKPATGRIDETRFLEMSQ